MADAEAEVWTVGRMLDWMRGYLERKGDENPRLSAQWLLSHATGLSRIELYMNMERPLSLDERDILRDLVQRRGAGEPLQYLTGTAPFRHLTMKVRPGVLIPRPETEVLVSEALALLPAAERVRSREFLAELADMSGDGADGISSDMSEDMPSAPSPDMKEAGGATVLSLEERAVFAEEPVGEAPDLLVADIGTGSGCIACSLVYEHPRIRVVATDVSAEALAVARENAEANGLEERITFCEGDLGSAVPAEHLGRFDAVVSNPPYIPADVLAAMPREVTAFEPDLALAGGADGLDVFRRLLPWALDALKPEGFLACELHETTLDAAAALARSAGFAETRIVCDLAEKPRVLIALKAASERKDASHGA